MLELCGQLRLQLGQKYNDRHKLLDPEDLRFLWVVEFPMFEWDEEDQRWNAAHHPFTSVHDGDFDKLTSDPANCRAKSYDLVLNGVELGRARSEFTAAMYKRKCLPPSVSAKTRRSAVWVLAGGAGIWRAPAWWNCAGA